MDKVFEKQCLLYEELEEINDPDQYNKKIQDYIISLDNEKVILDDFGKDLEWLNTDEKLSLHKDFNGKIVVLDFFTYCCINCIHMLPELHKLETRYSQNEEVAVIGVHSAKFDNERTFINIAQAILKYDITHPVVNDPKAVLWEKHNIQCWPTLLILGPELQVLFVLVGESDKEKLFRFTDIAVKHFSSKILTTKKIPVKLLKNSAKDNLLSFPGKVSFDAENQLICIADSGHNRIIISTKEGLVQDVIGGPENGFKDGSYSDVRFSNPQGTVFFQGKFLFVADTGNHAIRKINLVDRTVTTVIGTGSQGFDLEGGQPGLQQNISSPWDLCLGPAIGSNEIILYIAMAGTHQIWGYTFKECVIKSQTYEKDLCFALAGNGNEENRNNCYPKKASFAQPSGLTFAKTENIQDKSSPYLYIADSESSSIRSISLVDGSVKPIVGGDRNPTNLFAYGDKDGKFYDVKLQHPMGVCFCPRRNLIFVADTFNHKIKKVNPVTKECVSLNISGLNEPSGIFLFHNDLYIANSNSHDVLIYNVETETIQKLPLYLSHLKNEDSVDGFEVNEKISISGEPLSEFSLDPLEINPGGNFHLRVEIHSDKNVSFSEEAPHSWNLSASGDFLNSCKGQLSGSKDTLGCDINLKINDTVAKNSSNNIKINVRLFVCDKETGVCAIREANWLLKMVIVDKSGFWDVKTNLNMKINK